LGFWRAEGTTTTCHVNRTRRGESRGYKHRRGKQGKRENPRVRAEKKKYKVYISEKKEQVGRKIGDYLENRGKGRGKGRQWGGGGSSLSLFIKERGEE